MLTPEELRIGRTLAARAWLKRNHPATPGYGKLFMRTYLPHYAMRPDGSFIAPAEWHGEFHGEVFGSLGLGVRKTFLAPRGYAKSTTANLATPLIAFAHRMKTYGLIVEDTKEQAKLAMAGLIHELDENTTLLHDFPHLRRAVDRKGQSVSDRDDDVVLDSGARIQAVGAGQKIRGRRHRQHRPDLVIIDDLENDEAVETKNRRDKLERWLDGTLMGALGPDADVYYVGTLLHHDAVLARKIKSDAWESHRYLALTDPTDFETTTWPAFFPAERLAQVRKDMGSRMWSREMLHQPVDEDSQMFPARFYRYRSDDYRERLLNHADQYAPASRLVIAVDSAFSMKTTADYSVVLTAAQIGGMPEYDVLDVWRGRTTQGQLVKRILAEREKWAAYKPVVVAETVQAQVWLAEALREEGVVCRDVTPKTDKVSRAEPSTVLYENGQVWHAAHLRDSEYEDESVQFPMGEHDDMVDARTYALDWLVRKKRARASL